MSILEQERTPPIGLILSGGGARAAYQVGVLRAIADLMPTFSRCPFRVISGTSAGALNAVSLAGHASNFRHGVRLLEHIWNNLRSDKVYDVQNSNLLSKASSLVLGAMKQGSTEQTAALLDNTPLQALLARVIRFDCLQENINSGLLDAISVTASAYSTGESVSFYQGQKGIEDWQGPHRIGRRSELTLEHLLASTAIPLIFPSVQIGHQFFGDGAIRQLAPTSTALHLGARKLFVIGVSGNRNKQPLEDEQTEQPGLAQILGHMLNSAFVDTLDNDVEFLRHMNDVVPLIPQNKLKNKPLHANFVEILEISPSKELNRLATEYYDELPRQFSRYIKSDSAGSILSLVLFEKGFCKALWEMGRHDALEQETRIREFLSDYIPA